MKVGYLRISKEDDLKLNESESISNQKKLLLDYATKNKFEITKFYIDDGYSGGNFDRPAFKEMISDISLNRIDTVITKDISRLGRDFIETSQYIYKFFPENHIRYIAILENFDSFNPNGMDDIIPFRAIINDMYLKDISRKIKSVRHCKMYEGKYMGSTVPYGFVRNKSNKYTFAVDEYASNVVRDIFNMKIKGMSNLSISKYLTKSKILPPSVYKCKNIPKTDTTYIWKSSTVEKILTNEVYIGTLIQNKVSNINYKSKKRIPLNENDWIKVKGAVPSIIDENTFFCVQNIIDKKKRTRENKYKYLLKGLVICKECQKKMLVRRKKVGMKDIPYYCCKSNVTLGKDICTFHYMDEIILNKIVLDAIKKVIKEYDLNVGIFNSIALSKLNDMYMNINASQRRIDVLNNILKNVYRDYISQNISMNQFNSLKSEIREKISVELRKIGLLEYDIRKIEKAKDDEKYRKQIIENFFALKDISQEIVYDFVSRVEIDKNRNIFIFI